MIVDYFPCVLTKVEPLILGNPFIDLISLSCLEISAGINNPCFD